MKKGHIVRLESYERTAATNCGLKRWTEAKEQGMKNRYGAAMMTKLEQFYISVAGAHPEMAFAKGAGLYCPLSVSVNHSLPDVHPNWQVRSADFDIACLIIRPKDPMDQRFALMTGITPNFVFRGWIFGHEGCKPDFFKKDPDKGDCWMVPQKFLRDDTDVIEPRKEQPNAQLVLGSTESL